MSAGNTYRQARWAVLNPRQAWLRSKPVQWYQRARYGYSDVDMFSLDCYLAQILASAAPRHLTADAEWNADMERMADLFAGYEVDKFSYGDNDAQARCREAVDLLAENFGGLWT